jgi:hypothetical protein
MKRTPPRTSCGTNQRLGWRASSRSGVRDGSADWSRRRKQIDSWTKSGRKKSAQLFYFFMCLRMVSALRPFAMSIFAICREYHTSNILWRFFFKSRYAFLQASYIACVSSFRASRLALLGV